MKDFLLKPLQGIALGFAFMLGAHALVIFLIRPVTNLIDNISFSDIITWTIGSGIIAVVLGLFFDYFVKPAIEQVWGENIAPQLSKYVSLYICFSFFSVGQGFRLVSRFLGIHPTLIIIFPVMFSLCFLSTFLDYLAIEAGLDVSVNIFSDRIIKDIEEVTSIQSMVDWIAEDQVSINNFWQYWFYSLRASILGIRFKGIYQFFAFNVNIIASILFIKISINQAMYGLYGFKIRWNNNDKSLYDMPSEIVRPQAARPFAFLISGIIAVFLMVGQFALSALSVNRAKHLISTSRLNRTSTLNSLSQPRLTPQQTVAKYYELATHDRESALELIGESWKKAERQNREEGIKFWNSIEQVRVYGTDIIEQSSNRVIVKVWLQYYMKYEDYNPCETRTFDVRLNTENQWILHLPMDVVQKPSCDY
ncbi:MAG: hypothetical protein EA414_19900 [Arthrospira sp. PLM2.Bin9]|nr:hypothetical protein [Arthrospira sp. PLM2.Bin9]TVU51995.1 MAG: hypothetical protein EA414_19900 [Arthrospira sp. PLM2.Bin9]